MADTKSLFATTLRTFNKTMYDNVFNSSALLSWLRANKRMETFTGPFINERIVVGKNSSVDFRDGKAALTVSDQDPFTVAQWTPKVLDGIVPLYLVDQIRNSGPGEVSNLINDLVQNLQDTLTEKLCGGMYATGGATLIDGLDTIMSTTSTYGSVQDNSGNFSSIDRSATGATVSAMAALWKSNVYATSAALQIASGSESMAAMLFACGSGQSTQRPDLIVTTPALFALYNASLTANQRFTSDKMAGLGFENLTYMGIPVVYDYFCPAQSMYFINSKFLKLKVAPQCMSEFILTDKHQMELYLAELVIAAWMGNLVCTAPRNVGALRQKY